MINTWEIELSIWHAILLTTDTFEKCDLHLSFWVKISQSEIWLFLLSVDSTKLEFAYYYKSKWSTPGTQIGNKIGILQLLALVKIIDQQYWILKLGRVFCRDQHVCGPNVPHTALVSKNMRHSDEVLICSHRKEITPKIKAIAISIKYFFIVIESLIQEC